MVHMEHGTQKTWYTWNMVYRKHGTHGTWYTWYMVHEVLLDEVAQCNNTAAQLSKTCLQELATCIMGNK